MRYSKKPKMKAPEEYSHQPPLPPRRHHHGFTMMMSGHEGIPRGTEQENSDTFNRRSILPVSSERWSNNHTVLPPRTENVSGSSRGNLHSRQSSRSLLPRDAETLILLEDFPDSSVSSTLAARNLPHISNSGAEMLTRIEREHRFIQEQLHSSPNQNVTINSDIQRDLETIQRELIRHELREAVERQNQHPLLYIMESLLSNNPSIPPRFPSTPMPTENISLDLNDADRDDENPWMGSSDGDDSIATSTHEDASISILDDYLNISTFHSSNSPFDKPLIYEGFDRLPKIIRENRIIKRTFAPNVPFQSEQIKCNCSCSNSADGELWSPESCICYQQLLLNQQHASYLALHRQEKLPIR